MNYTLEALAGLSLQHASKHTVQAPTNEDRLRAFRACIRPEIGNTRMWRWIQTGDADAMNFQSDTSRIARIAKRNHAGIRTTHEPY